MHAHVHGVTPGPAHLPANLVLDRAAEARRAALVRRRLLEQAGAIELDESPEANWMREAWAGRDGGKQRRSHAGAPNDVPEQHRPVSFWA